MTIITDPLLAVTRALGAEKQDEIVRRFTHLNRHWVGAEPADIIEALVSNDSDLDVLEPFFEANADEFGDVEGAPEAARALIWSGQAVTPESMRDLLGAAGLL